MKKAEPPSGPRKALGKGLSALLPAKPAEAPQGGERRSRAREAATQEGAAGESGTEAIRYIPIERIAPNPHQPRQHFDPARLEELAQSIRRDGVIQPVVVRAEGDVYVLVVGERRWRAARLAELDEIPAIVRDIPANQLLEFALIENIQREDLNPIELALALESMGIELHLSQEEIALRTGKDRATVANLLRLLRLPSEVQRMIEMKELSLSHAKAILALEGDMQQTTAAQSVVKFGMSVRATERMVQRMMDPKGYGLEEVRADPNVMAAIREMEAALGSRVYIVEWSSKRGKIVIEYYSPEELERIYTAIVRAAPEMKNE